MCSPVARMTRFLQCISLFIFTIGISGCGNECSPLGTYVMVLSWQSGDCSFVEPGNLTIVVGKRADGAFGVALPTSSDFKDLVAVDDDRCIVSLNFTLPPRAFMNLPIGVVFTMNITDEGDNKLGGSGQINVGDPITCSHRFSVSGQKT